MPDWRIVRLPTAVAVTAYRQIAHDTLLRLQQQSLLMARLGRLPGTPLAECERLAVACDLLVCSVGHR